MSRKQVERVIDRCKRERKIRHDEEYISLSEDLIKSMGMSWKNVPMKMLRKKAEFLALSKLLLDRSRS